MKAPTPDDKVAKVRAFMTDEGFGYDHWRATQFTAPSDSRPAVLIICDTEGEQAAWLEALAVTRSVHIKEKK